MKVSQYLQLVEKNGNALCFHSLRGNLFFLESDYLVALKQLSNSSIQSAKINSKIIQDFVNAGYLIKDDEDEREFLRIRNKKWMEKVPEGGQLHLLNLMISEACNFGCNHCLHRCSVEKHLTHGNKKLMDWNIAHRSIDEYATIMKKWDRQLKVHFGSAEPLLNWSILKKCIEHIRVLDKNAHLAVNTNLSLLTMEMAIFFRDNGVYISTSLDGPQIGNDSIRVFTDKKGTFDVIVSKFKLLSDIDYPLDGFSITINHLNFESLDTKFIDWAHEQGFKGIASDIDLVNASNSRYSINDYIEKLMELRHACQKYNIESFGTWTTAYDNLVNEPEDDMPTFCKAVKGRNISVNPSGRIFICGHTNTDLGSLSEFEKVFQLNGSYYKLVKSRLPGSDPICFSCPLEGVCAGQCQITREVANITKNRHDSLLCQFYRKVTRELLRDKLTAELVNN